MGGGGEYEPQDSRNATTKNGKSWRDKEDARNGRGEYEPRDTRNATGQPSSEPDRWEKSTDPPKADD